MLVGRLTGAAIGGKVSSKTMLTFTSGLGLILILAGILIPASATVELSTFGVDQIPVKALLFVLVGLCTSIMWGGIFNLAVEGLENTLQQLRVFS